jgi:hypothetical protein
VGLAIQQPENAIEEMLIGIRDSLSDSASSSNGADWEYKYGGVETELGMLSKDEELGCVMVTISSSIQLHM